MRDLQFRSFWRCSDRHVSADVCLKLGRQDVRRRGRGRGQNLPQDCRLDFQQSTCILLAFSTYFQESTCVTFCTHQVRGLPATATACLPAWGRSQNLPLARPQDCQLDFQVFTCACIFHKSSQAVILGDKAKTFHASQFSTLLRGGGAQWASTSA